MVFSLTLYLKAVYSTVLHDSTSLKIVLFIEIIVRTPNPTFKWIWGKWIVRIIGG
jgi:hypothetical protein